MNNPLDECFIIPSDRKADIRKRYEEPHRKYHNTEHICKIWNYYWFNERGDSWHERIKLATIFHDVIYNVGDPDNELKSAEYFREVLDLNPAPFGVMGEIYSTILATKDHLNPKYNALPKWSQLFLDLDLYELGSEESVYRANGQKIREEYRSVFTDEQITAGRIRWLESFLSHNRIFRIFISREEQARTNLENELKELKCNNTFTL